MHEVLRAKDQQPSTKVFRPASLLSVCTELSVEMDFAVAFSEFESSFEQVVKI